MSLSVVFEEGHFSVKKLVGDALQDDVLAQSFMLSIDNVSPGILALGRSLSDHIEGQINYRVTNKSISSIARSKLLDNAVVVD